MDRSIRIRVALVALILGAVYFYLLVYLIGWTSIQHWPSWWYAFFSSKHIALITWLILLHTVGVLSAAVPVAIAVVVTIRREAVSLAAIVGLLGSMLGILPTINADVWSLYWNSHPVFVVTDQIKIIFAVPLVAWLVRKVSSKGGFHATAVSRQE